MKMRKKKVEWYSMINFIKMDPCQNVNSDLL